MPARPSLSEDYLATVTGEVAALRAQLPAIRKAGRLLANSWRGSGCLFVTKTNHTMYTELVGRAGGPVAVRVLDDGGARYDEELSALPDVRRGDVILVYSNRGNNNKTGSIIALARALGAHVIALTQVGYERYAAPLPGSAKRGTADAVIDIGGVIGDAALALPASGVRICPTSGVTGVATAWAIVAAACEFLAEEGREPVMLRSIQYADAIAVNRRAQSAWQTRRVRRETQEEQ